MKNFSSSSLLTRLVWALGLLLIAAGAAQAQITVYNITLTPNNGLLNAGTVVTVRGFDLVGGAQNALAQTATSGTIIGTSVGSTAGPTNFIPTPNGSTTDPASTFTIPATFTAGTYTVTLTNLDVLTVQIAGSNVATFTVNAPLPVQLVAFTAETVSSSARLSWNTASEKNNDHFDIESSIDGRTFARIGSVAGHGNSLVPQQYAYADENLARYAAPLVYYRLRQVDFDGTTSFSLVRTVTATPGKAILALYPTVAADGQATHYAYTGPVLAADATLEVYDATGHRVLAQPLGEVTGTLAAQALASGWYWVRLAGAAPTRFYRP